jgi:hypothetical protein
MCGYISGVKACHHNSGTLSSDRVFALVYFADVVRFYLSLYPNPCKCMNAICTRCPVDEIGFLVLMNLPLIFVSQTAFMVVIWHIANIRPMSNVPADQPRPRRRIVRDGSIPAASSTNRSIVSEFSPIGCATPAAYDHRLVTNSLEPANVGWQNNGCKNLTSN